MDCVDANHEFGAEHSEKCNSGENIEGCRNETKAATDGCPASDAQDNCSSEKPPTDEKNKSKANCEFGFATKKMTAKYRDKDFSDHVDKFSQNGDQDGRSQLEERTEEEENTVLKYKKTSSNPPSAKLDGAAATSSAKDFLQKMVQEQKSQVPTLFCRELPVLNDASKVYNTMDLKSSAKLFTPLIVPNSVSAADAKLALQAAKTVTSILSPAAKNMFVCSEANNNVTSSDVGKGETVFYKNRKPSDDRDGFAVTPPESATPSSGIVQNATHSGTNGKLRFYLDGQFVLELMHARSSKRGTSGSWVQSKGKIWTPVSQATDVSSRTSGKRSFFATQNPPPTQSNVAEFPSPANSVSSLFMVQIAKLVRLKYLCWISQNEIRRAARNSAVNLSVIYQLALQRNRPIRCFSTQELQKNRIRQRHKRKTLNDLWKMIQKSQHNCTNQFPSCANQLAGFSKTANNESGSKSSKSLLLSALTKPKVKEEKQSDGFGAIGSASTPSNGASKTLEMPTEDASWEYKMAGRVKDNRSDFAASSNVNVFNRAKPTRCGGSQEPKSKAGKSQPSLPLLPLPDWYLDPSKAEVPVSEMIGYPRPYFPPASTESSSPHLAKKRYQENSPSSYPAYVLNKKLCLKEEELFNGKCMKSEGRLSPGANDSGLTRESYSNQWLAKPSFAECPEESTSPPPVDRTKIAYHADSESESTVDYSPSNSGDPHLKVRCAKRFGSYGRGHAVNEAIRTFVISDIVNLGGDVESRYVPRGVYPEVASRYKIDVSTTTRWWLRYCSDNEHASSKMGEASQPARKSNLEPCPGPSEIQAGDASSNAQIPLANIKSEFVVSNKMKTPISLKKMYISSHLREREGSFANDTSSAADKNKNQRLEENPASPSTQHDSCSSDGRHALLLVEDAPLDLSVKRIKTEHPSESVHAMNTRHYNSSTKTNFDDRTSSHRPIPNTIAALERMSPTDRSTFNHKIVANSLQRHPMMFVAGKSDPTREEPAGGVLRKSEKISTQAANLEDNYDLRMFRHFDIRHMNHRDANSLTSGLSKPSDAIHSSSSSYAISEKSGSGGSQTIKVVVPSKQHSSLETKACDSDHEMKSRSTPSLCLGLQDLRKSEYPPLGVPVNGMASGVSPTSALASWPYPHCQMMAYGPALINSYYYCCCYLPGCRFHYVYSPNGQAVDTGNTLAASSPMLVSNGYAKCCSSVADVSPVLLDSVYPDNMYKAWEPSLFKDAKAEAKSSEVVLSEKAPSIDASSSEEEIATSQSTAETRGSMLKHLLLKPSRATPEPKSPSLASSNAPSSTSVSSLEEEAAGSRPASVSNSSPVQHNEAEPQSSSAFSSGQRDGCRSSERAKIDDVTSSHSTNDDDDGPNVSALLEASRSPEININDDSSDGSLQIDLTDTETNVGTLEEAERPKSPASTNGEGS